MYDLYSIFDYPDASVSFGQRPSTVVSSQALFFLNAPLGLEAERLADILHQSPVDAARRNFGSGPMQGSHAMKNASVLKPFSGPLGSTFSGFCLERPVQSVFASRNSFTWTKVEYDVVWQSPTRPHLDARCVKPQPDLALASVWPLASGDGRSTPAPHGSGSAHCRQGSRDLHRVRSGSSFCSCTVDLRRSTPSTTSRPFGVITANPIPVKSHGCNLPRPAI